MSRSWREDWTSKEQGREGLMTEYRCHQVEILGDVLTKFGYLISSRAREGISKPHIPTYAAGQAESDLSCIATNIRRSVSHMLSPDRPQMRIIPDHQLTTRGHTSVPVYAVRTDTPERSGSGRRIESLWGEARTIPLLPSGQILPCRTIFPSTSRQRHESPQEE